MHGHEGLTFDVFINNDRLDQVFPAPVYPALLPIPAPAVEQVHAPFACTAKGPGATSNVVLSHNDIDRIIEAESVRQEFPRRFGREIDPLAVLGLGQKQWSAKTKQWNAKLGKLATRMKKKLSECRRTVKARQYSEDKRRRKNALITRMAQHIAAFEGRGQTVDEIVARFTEASG
jgi:hypothetical protein